MSARPPQGPPRGLLLAPALLPVALFARLAVIAQRHGKDPAELLGWLIERAADDQL